MSETAEQLVEQTHTSTSDANWPRNVDARLKRLGRATMEVTVELGRTRIPLEDVLNAEPGTIVETRKLVGMPLDIFVNNTLFAKAETIVVGDHLAVRICDLIPPDRR